MYQLISIYCVGDHYLAHPNSIPINIGIFIANGPALDLPSDSSDEILGGEVLSLISFCNNTSLKAESISNIQFPFTGITKVKSWNQLPKKSPTMLQLRVTPSSTEIHRWVKSGFGYTEDSDSLVLKVDTPIQASILGASIRSAFHPAP